ncbi:MAG: Sec-independent protein translocase subunit TatA/TatB [Elusimicrobiota bacterium]|jgi:sec-independent protein translocase protein TatA
MLGMGIQELLLIAAVGLLLFGAKNLPEAGRGLGRAIASFKEALREPAETKEDGREKI